MTKKILSRSLILVSVFFLVFSNKTFALSDAAPCTPDTGLIKYLGPFSTIFDGNESIDNDCQYPGDDSPLVTEVVDTGRIFCTRGYLKATFDGRNPLNVNPAGQQGLGDVSLKDVSTYALGGKILDKEGEDADKLVTYRKAVEAYRNYDLTSLYREAYYEGVTVLSDFLDWAQKKGLTVDGSNGPHLNPSIYAARQQQLTLKDQVIEIIRTLSEIYDCNMVPGYANYHRCSPNYFTKRSGDERVLDLAKQIGSILKIDDPLGNWAKLSKTQQFQALTLHVTRSSPTFVVFIPAGEGGGKCEGLDIWCFLKQFISSFFAHYNLANKPEPKYIKAMLPETTNILEGVNDEYNRFNPLKKNTNPVAASPSANLTASTETVTDAHDFNKTLLAQATTPPKSTAGYQETDDKLLNRLMKRAIAYDPDCVKGPITTSENLGSTADVVKNKDRIWWPFQEIAKDAKEAGERMDLYHIYLFTPPDILSANERLAKNDNSMFRKLMPLKTTGFEEEIYVPQDLTGTSKNRTVPSPHWYGEWIEVCDPGCHQVPKMIDDHYNYEVTTENITQPGGWFSQNKKQFTFGAFRPLNSNDNIKDQNKCLLEQHLQPGAMREGFDLITSINASQFSQTKCPNPIKKTNSSTTTPPPTDGINCKQNVPINPTDYGLCSTESIANLASRWVSGAGKHYVTECIGDVVSRANAAGIDPALAVYMWIHESGASNYTWWEGLGNGKTLEDFGIHGSSSAPPENFSAQLDYFLSVARGINAHCASEMQQYGMLNSFYSNLWFGECNPESTKMETRNGETKSIKEWMQSFKNDAASTWSGVSCK